MRLIFPALFSSHRFKSEQQVRILIFKVANLILTFTDLIWDDHTLRCTSLKYLTNQGLTALASISRFQRSSIKFEVAHKSNKILGNEIQGVRQYWIHFVYFHLSRKVGGQFFSLPPTTNIGHKQKPYELLASQNQQKCVF